MCIYRNKVFLLTSLTLLSWAMLLTMRADGFLIERAELFPEEDEDDPVELQLGNDGDLKTCTYQIDLTKNGTATTYMGWTPTIGNEDTKICWNVTRGGGVKQKLRFHLDELNFEYCGINCANCSYIAFYSRLRGLIAKLRKYKRILGKQCTRSKPPYSFTSEGNEAVVLLYLDRNFRMEPRKYSFRIEQVSMQNAENAEDEESCAGSVVKIDPSIKSGTIQNYVRSDGWHRYGENCTWQLEAPDAQHTIRFTFRRMLMRGKCASFAGDCSKACDDTSPNEHVSIWENGGPFDDSAMVTKMCGFSKSTYRYVTMSHKATVRFVTLPQNGVLGFNSTSNERNGNVSYFGFILDFDVISADYSPCKDRFFGGKTTEKIAPLASSELSSYRRSADGYYRRFENCLKFYSTEPGYVFKVSMPFIDLHVDPFMSGDMLFFQYNLTINGEWEEIITGGVDGFDSKPVQIYPTQKSRLQFATESLRPHYGFKGTIDSVPAEDYLSEKRIETISANDPNDETANITNISNYRRSTDGRYRMSEDHQWLVLAPNNDYNVRFVFTHLYIDRCETDYVAIYDGSEIGKRGTKMLAKLCGRRGDTTEMLTYQTETSAAVVHFFAKNNDDHSGDGFNVTFEAVRIRLPDDVASLSDTMIVVISIGSVLVAINFGMLFFVIKWYQKKIAENRKKKEMLDAMLQETYFAGKESVQALVSDYGCDRLTALVSRLDIAAQRIELPALAQDGGFESSTGSKISQGHFSKVSRATLDKDKPVVLKRLNRTESRQDDVKRILREGFIMQTLEHDNLLQLLGIAVINETPNLVFPFMKNGNLKDYLRNSRESTKDQQLIKFCSEICLGMEYLHSKKFIHCDLACRNVLVDVDLTAKVSDFGLSRDLDPARQYQQLDGFTEDADCPIPVRWAPPEFFNQPRIITAKGDIWSYGVVCWEIYSLCQTEPYSEIKIIADVIDFVCSGNRLSKPNRSRQDFFDQVMLPCWRTNREDRPDFAVLAPLVANLLIS